FVGVDQVGGGEATGVVLGGVLHVHRVQVLDGGTVCRFILAAAANRFRLRTQVNDLLRQHLVGDVQDGRFTANRIGGIAVALHGNRVVAEQVDAAKTEIV